MYFYEDNEDPPKEPELEEEEELDEEEVDDGEDAEEEQDEQDLNQQDNQSSNDRRRNRKDDDSKDDVDSSKQDETAKPDSSSQGEGNESLDRDKINQDLNDINNKKKAPENKGEKTGNSQESGSDSLSKTGDTGTTTPSGGEKTVKSNLGSGQSGAEVPIQSASKPGVQTGSQTITQPGAQSATGGTTTSATTATTEAVSSGGGATTTAGAAAGLSAILFWVLVIVLIIIIVVGLIFFLTAMPGQVTEKLNKLGEDFVMAMQSVIHGEEDAVVRGEDIADVANYLESMGYDLKGEGFITSDITKESSVSQPSNSYADSDQGVYRDNDTDQVVLADSSPIRIYLVSDNLCYIIKNFNTNLDAATGGHGALFAVGAAILTVIAGIVFSPAIALIALVGTGALFISSGNPNWGSGLISIYHEADDTLGKRGTPYSERERGYIELTPTTKKLKVKRGWTNEAYTFDINGWSGRYGMPLEFLLSVHIATQMPDLAMEMATTFDTDVEVLLRDVSGGEIIAGYKIGSGNSDSDFITWRQIMDVVQSQQNGFSGLWNTFINWAGDVTSFIDSDEAQLYTIQDKEWVKLFQIGIPHAEGCSCCSHIPGSTGSGGGDCAGTGNLDTYSDEFDLGSHTICSTCKNNVYKIIGALQEIQDSNWNSYTPYISKVTNHWFRDVYFVINAGEDDLDGKNFVQVDEDYFYETNERWTIYETYTESDDIPEGFEVGDYKLYEYKEDGTYVLSTRSKEEVDALNEEIQKGTVDAIKLVKKSITEAAPASWNAYTIVDGVSSWKQIEVTEETSEIVKEFDGDLYYKETRPSDVKQVEDGQRTETNSTIKDMFVNKAYYHYDGSVEKANKINEDRNATSAYRDLDNTEQDKRDESLISKVSIAKDSLGAFSILENTHTLDADYIYRDFKELIVELDYFDKEDLSEKIQRVMQWPIPDCGSTGWPIRKYEKGETFYGTLINSMVDIELMTNADIEAAEKILAELQEEVETDPNVTVTGTGSVPGGSVADLVAKGYEVHQVMEGNDWDYCIGSAWSDPNGQPHFRSNCTDANCSRQHCGEYSPGGHVCGLDSTIQEAQARHHNTCCATYVSWALKEAGFDLSNHPNIHGAHATYLWCEAEGWTPITDYNELEPGDLLFNHGSMADLGHVQMLGNNGEWLNAGSVNAINKPPYSYQADFIIGMRSKMNGAKETFKGYEPNQAVVAPITGKVTEYGEVERVNEETGKTETVEFIKIEAIHNYLYDTEGTKGEGYLQCTDIEDTFEDKASSTAKKLEGYDYFYEEYQGVIDGFVLYIEGFDLTLFDSDGAVALVNSGEIDSSDVTRYEENEVYNMVDDLKEARAIWKEEAKTFALPIVKTTDENGEEVIYIKEGTVIGKTLEDPDMSEVEIVSRTNLEGEEVNVCTGNGNYMRLILRDLEDSIVEDVESYMNIEEDTVVATPQPYQAQEGDLQLLANLLHHEGCEAYFTNILGDSKLGADASRVTGYVVINRALLNYGNHGTTIREQILAPGQYSTAIAVTEGGDVNCDLCLANAEWCLTYDCMSVISPSSGEPMTRNVVGQSGWCQCSSDIGEFNCWWWVDTTKDGTYTEHSGPGSAFDTFYCKNTQFPES